MKRILIFTDGRGLGVPAGGDRSPGFAQKLASSGDVDVRLVLSPVLGTTIPDLLTWLEFQEQATAFSAVVLLAGLNDWVERPAALAYSEFYDAAGSASRRMGRNGGFPPELDYLAERRRMFDQLFGQKQMMAHLGAGDAADPQRVTNLYSLEMAQRSLLPRLAEIPNLLFINSNRPLADERVELGSGAQTPDHIVEAYSRTFAEALGADRVIDLLSWNRRAVRALTVDGVHFNEAGHDWLCSALHERLAGRKAPVSKPAGALRIDRSEDRVFLQTLQKALQSQQPLDPIFIARKAKDRVLEGMDYKWVDRTYLSVMAPFYTDEQCRDIAALSAHPLSDQAISDEIDRAYVEDSRAAQYLEAKVSVYRRRRELEYEKASLCDLQVFPYEYFGRYSFRSEPVATPDVAGTTIDFIYCIKNRVKRTTLSVESLARSARKYAETGGRRITVRVTIVEDVSADILDPDTMSFGFELDHYIVDTGVRWTRSGLLNVGIMNSPSDLVAFVDSDFLFHEGYVQALDDYLSQTNWRAHVIANNLIESETHDKTGLIYSELSPYSFMWMAPTRAAQDVGGFDEGYEGHGYEDRDMELKLVKLAGLTVADTASIVPECFVLHLSHNQRDGYDKHEVNRDRYRQREAFARPSQLLQDRWGEQDILWATRTRPASARATGPQAAGLWRARTSPNTSTQPLNYRSRGDSSTQTLYLVVSCQAYEERRKLLAGYYDKHRPPEDNYVFLVGGAKSTHFDPSTRTLHITAGDFYEDLPEKVLMGVEAATRSFDFRHLVKVDDDVVINFPLFKRLINGFEADYFGKMIPSRRGAKPSPTWHIGKVSERSPFFDKPFEFEGGPSNWACGGMYAMTRSAAERLSARVEGFDANAFLYEDHMVGSFLDQAGILPAFIEEHPGLAAYRFIQTDLRDLMDEPLARIVNPDLAVNVGGVHCGGFPPLYSVDRNKCVRLMEAFIALYTASGLDRSRPVES